MLRAKPMYLNGNAQSIVIIVPRNLRKDCEDHFQKAIGRAAAGLQFRIPPPVLIEIENDNTRNVIEGLENYISKRGNPSMKVKFLLFNYSRS